MIKSTEGINLCVECEEGITVRLTDTACPIEDKADESLDLCINSSALSKSEVSTIHLNDMSLAEARSVISDMKSAFVELEKRMIQRFGASVGE